MMRKACSAASLRWTVRLCSTRATVQRMRTHDCGELRASVHAGQTVALAGWISSQRMYGQLLFLNLRDAGGLTQLVLTKEESGADLFAKAARLQPEAVVHVAGTVRARPGGMVNSELPTGDVEVTVTGLEVLNEPVQPVALRVQTEIGRHHGSDEARLRNRHLDLRGAEMQRNLRVRSLALGAARRLLTEDLGFLEIETPMLFKSTPEGAREFLVPARESKPGSCYALPQSPQQYKQMLMASGVERYYQVARCFRDEGGRADRQPEFTQLDLELAFVREPDEVMHVVEMAVRTMWNGAAAAAPSTALPPLLRRGITPGRFRRLTYSEALLRYGSDKPDTRLGLELTDVTSHFGSTLNGIVAVHALRIPLGDSEQRGAFSRKRCEALAERTLAVMPPLPRPWREAGGGGCIAVAKACRPAQDLALGPVVIRGERWGTEVFVPPKQPGDNEELVVAHQRALEACGAEEGDVVVFSAVTCGSAASAAAKTCSPAERAPDTMIGVGAAAACWALGDARTHCALERIATGEIEPPPPDSLDLFWVTDFPLFEIDDTSCGGTGSIEANSTRLKAVHHPFSAPAPADRRRFDAALADLVLSGMHTPASGRRQDREAAIESLLGVRASHYDLVANGVELGGGSLRLHDAEAQRAVLEGVLGMPPRDIDRDFGHLLEALGSGCPPHGGFALGIDRALSTMLYAGVTRSSPRRAGTAAEELENVARLLRGASVREVIAFPKTTGGRELLTGSPSQVADERLKEYKICRIDFEDEQ